MAVTTKILFPATSNSSTTDFSLSGLQLNNQDDLDVYVTKTTAGIAANNNKRILHFRQSTSSNVDANHNQVNNTDGLYFPAITHTGGTETLENYQIVNNNGTVRFNSALPNGAIVFVERRTRDEDGTYTSFASGSTIRATDLNNSSTESNFTAQEARNKAFTIEGVLFDGDQPNTNFVTSSHIVDGSIVNADVNASAAIDGTKVNPNFGSQNIVTTGTVNGVSTTELSILDGATVTTSELNTLDGITASTAELNKLDGVTSTTSELNILDGVTASTAEINKLDGVTATTAELNLVDGVTATTAELNYVDGVTSNIQTQLNDKQPLDAELTELATMPSTTASSLADLTQAEVQILDGATVSTAELNTLDGVTASTTEINKLDGVTASTAELNLLDGVTATTNELNLNDGQTATPTEVNILDGATLSTNELNKLDGYTGSTADLNEVVAGKNVVETISGSATDAQIPTAQAVNERVVELVTEVGGFHPIANETSFPATNPDINDGAGTIVSIKALSNSFTTGSGVTTKVITNGAGSGNNVTITGLTQSTTYPAGRGMLLETTSTLHTYTFHRLTLDETGVADAQAAIDDFDERYYGALSSSPSTRPSGANRQNGDLFFNTSDGKMKVYNGSHASGTWDDVAAPGNFFINTLSSSSGSGGGSATFNGTATRFTLSNPPLSAQQLLVSVNGVVQKPNSGTSPSEGFAIDGADIIFASAPNTGASFFIVTIGSSVNIGTPSDNTVTSAKIVDGSIVNGDISSSAAIASSKLAKPIDLLDNEKIRFGTGNDLELYHSGAHNYLVSNNGILHIIGDGTNQLKITPKNGEQGIRLTPDGAFEAFYDNAKKLETTSAGIKVTGSGPNAVEIKSGTHELYSYHDSSGVGWATGLSGNYGELIYLNENAGSVAIYASQLLGLHIQSTATSLYYSGSKKFETSSTGATVTGSLYATGSIDVQDNGALLCGSADDLQIFHNGSGSFIDAYTTDLEIRNSGGELMAEFRLNNAVDLYHDGTKRLSTHSQGAIVNGHTLYVKGASGEDARLFFIANNSASYNDHYSINVAATGAFAIQTEVNANTFENLITATQHGNVELYYDNVKKFETTSTGTLMPDSAEARFGTGGNDLGIYHDATNNVNVINSRECSELQIRHYSEKAIVTKGNGAVELYHNNVKKFETTGAGVSVTGTVTCDALSFIPSGTKMLFQQTAAPSGWTKVTSGVNNSALRVVHGTAGSGGSNGFTSVFNSDVTTSGGSVASHTLTVAQIPSHQHSIAIRTGRDDDNFSFNNGFSSDSNTSGGTFNSNSTGGGQGHAHNFNHPSFNLNVAYTDVIICTKD